MMYVSTLSDNIDLGTAQFMWEKSNFQEDVADRIELYAKRLKEERSSADSNDYIISAIEETLKRYKWIEKQEIENEEKLDFLKWLFNNGKLRASNEIDIRLNAEEKKEQAKRNFFIQNKKDYKKAQYKSGLICFVIFIILPTLFSLIWGGIDGLSAFLGLTAVPCLLLFSAAMAFSLYSVDKDFGYDCTIAPKNFLGTDNSIFATDLRSFKKI